VLKTAVDAFERDLTPWILKDACASHAGPKAHAAGLFITGRFIGTNQIIQTTSIPESVLPLPA
jgi:nicotinamidase-related amidase